MTKKTEQIKPSYNLETGEVTMAYERDVLGEWQKEAGVTFKPAELPEEIQAQLLLYGLKAKLADTTSGIKLSAGWPAKSAGYAAVWEHLLEGSWNAKRSGGSAFKLDLYLVRVIANKAKITLAQAEAALKAAGKDKVLAMMADEKVVAAMDKMREADAKKGQEEVDLSSLFGE